MRQAHSGQIRVGRGFPLAVCAIGVGMLFPACSSSGLGHSADGSAHSDSGTGGASGTGTGGAGGTSGSGGVTSSGGSTRSGGTTSSGGTTTSGGTTAAGGSTRTGGATASGGVTSSGGVTRTGGATGATGGTTSSPPDCARVGCAQPPLCSEGCREPCGCCPCSPGVRSGDLICTMNGCYASAAAPDAGILVACSGQGDPLCGQGSSCIVGCPSKGAGGLCSVAGRETCGCGIIDQPCTTPGLECLYPSCCDYQGLCLTPPERQAVCAGPLAAKFNCTPAVGNPDAGTDAGADQAIDAPRTDAFLRADAAANSCENPLPLQCGDRLNHNTLIQGRPNVWIGYGNSQRWMGGPEAIYLLQPPTGCQAVVQLKNFTADIGVFFLPRCDPWSASSAPVAGQPSFVVVDGYDGAWGSYTLEVDCMCNQDGGTSDAPQADAQGGTAIAPGCDLAVASSAIAALGLTAVGTPQTLNQTLPAALATDDNWGLKATVCQQGGYDITPLAGKTVCLLGQDITQMCQGLPASVWGLMNNGAVACVYKTIRKEFSIPPGVYAANDANCVQPTIAAGATVSCDGRSCTSATGPCCPATTMMNRTGMCGSGCLPALMTCDGPEDCSNGAVCCSLESAAAGFVAASCVPPAECAAPSRVICHQQADCPSPQQCGVPNPMPTYISPYPYPESADFRVSFQVCAP